VQLGAEFVGTFILIFFATAAPIVNQKYGGAISPFGNAACAGLAVTIIILSTGHISGAHLNPSLTIAFAALRHFPWLQVPAYVSVQVLGSICASFALKGVFHPFLSGGVTVPDVTISTAQAFFTEFIITFNLLFVVTAVATDTRAVRPFSSYTTIDGEDASWCGSIDRFVGPDRWFPSVVVAGG
jgi:aquaporin NIP